MFKRLTGAYRALAIVSFNILVLFVALNVAAHFGLLWREHVKNLLGHLSPVYARYGAALAQAYPGRSLDDINRLLAETWNRPLRYAPFVQFREAPYRGTYVNVSAAGFRATGAETPWPPRPDRFNVFVFGGSTTFGYGVADDETVPAALGRLLAAGAKRPVAVYNFGQAYYASSQERALFERLLERGDKPDLAIFIDGLNEFIVGDEPFLTDRLRQAMDESLAGRVRWLAEGLPINRVLDWLLGAVTPAPAHAAAFSAEGRGAMAPAKAVARYWANVQMDEGVAQAAGIPVLFVWQPVPTYATEAAADPFYEHQPFLAPLVPGYAAIKPEFAARLAATRGAWCADLAEGVKDVLYVDAVHYSADMSKRLAGCIVEALKQRGPVP